MPNQQMWDSPTYKTYLAYVTGAASPKMERKLKKLASLSKKKAFKKAPAKAKRSKGLELISDAQLKKAFKKSKRETNIYQACGSTEGANFKTKVLVELKGKSIDTSKGSGLKQGFPMCPKLILLKASMNLRVTVEMKMQMINKVMMKEQNYVPTDDESNDEINDVTEEDYEGINEELYGDVNVSLTDVKPADKEKDDEEMSIAGHVNVNQEGAGNQVKDDAHATQKTEVPLPSSSISSGYAAKFLNFDNIPPTDTEVVSMLDINVQNEVPHTSSLLTIPVFVIPKQNVINQSETVTTTPGPTISSLFSSLNPAIQQIAPIATPTTTQATTSTTVVPNSETLNALHQITVDLEKDVKEIKDVDNSTKVISTIKSEARNVVKEYLGSSLDDALHKVLRRNYTDIIKEHYIPAEINRKQDDTDKDEGPSARSDQGLKRQKTSKDTKPSKKAKSTESSKGTSKSQPKSTSKSAQVEETVCEAGDTQGPQNLREDTERPPTPDPEWNKDFGVFVMNRLQISELIQDIVEGPAYNILKDWNKPKGDRYPFDLSKPLPLVMSGNRQIISVDYLFNNDLSYLQGGSTDRTYTTSLTKTKVVKYDLPRIEDMLKNGMVMVILRIEVRRSDQLINLIGDVTVHLAASLRMFTRCIVIQKRMEDLQLGIESYQKKLNISRPMTHKAGITDAKII
ncbi:hypothetical protein Tco_1124606 [Tanacetum coccineum]|uniref:Uncharacterized protein n=1 Tax=Tanacetum coccineum TaxID=301880 RepID=A0ABQ5J798_9ASTR